MKRQASQYFDVVEFDRIVQTWIEEAASYRSSARRNFREIREMIELVECPTDINFMSMKLGIYININRKPLN